MLLSLAGRIRPGRRTRPTSTHRPPAPAAEQAVERLNDRLVAVLNDGAKDTAARERALAKTLRSAMDFDTLTRFVLGRYAAELTRDQRQTFRQTFADYVVETYARLLARNAISDMAVIASRKVTVDTAAVATRVARRQGQSARRVWRMHRRELRALGGRRPADPDGLARGQLPLGIRSSVGQPRL
ncbi:MAG: ABC transporter substrate-binding protein [Rhodovibrio sp.]|nr:ABC transporter substrate-binding protein [Rhodovibrio sp.]